MPKQLGIHVIGPRLGESIVLELPDGGVGVIDSFGAGGGSHPIVQFLNWRFQGLSELCFFAVTHPHADHCFRCAEVCEAFTPKEVWCFRPFPLGQLREFYKALQKLGSTDSVEDAIGLPSGSVVHSLLKFEKQVSDLRKEKGVTYRALSWNRAVELCGGSVVVHFLTPGDDQQFRYAEQIKRSLHKITTDGNSLEKISHELEPDHNLASGGLLIEYGKSRALLMADAESELWDEWYASNPQLAKGSRVQFIKASHHGSKNGFHTKLYSELANRASTIAVLTPFNQGSVHLPSEEGVRLLSPCVKNVYCTSRSVAAVSTTLHWKPITPRPMPSLPKPWLRQITKKKSLARLLVPGTTASAAPSGGGRLPNIPGEWVIKAHKEPLLWHLFKPGQRLPIPGLAPAENHTVSVYLNDSGKITQVSGGDEAGVLDL